jgi:hypothetical protein
LAPVSPIAPVKRRCGLKDDDRVLKSGLAFQIATNASPRALELRPSPLPVDEDTTLGEDVVEQGRRATSVSKPDRLYVPPEYCGQAAADVCEAPHVIIAQLDEKIDVAVGPSRTNGGGAVQDRKRDIRFRAQQRSQSRQEGPVTSKVFAFPGGRAVLVRADPLSVKQALGSRPSNRALGELEI